MILTIPSVARGEYNTEIFISEKKDVSKPFWVVDVVCSSASYTGRITDIVIKNKELEMFISDLGYIEKNGYGRASLTSVSKKDFSLKIRSIDSVGNFIADVFIKSKSGYMKISYEIDLSILISLLRKSVVS